MSVYRIIGPLVLFASPKKFPGGTFTYREFTKMTILHQGMRTLGPPSKCCWETCQVAIFETIFEDSGACDKSSDLVT